jgi:hypothetical protein
MRKMRNSSEAEMIAAFLAAELHSPRSMGQELQACLQREALSQQVILSPDLANEDENATRRALLGAYRGYGLGQGYFQGFPEALRWELVGLTRQEVEQVKYIDYDYWVELSGGSRLALDGARRALAGGDAFWLSSRYFVDLAETLKRGESFPTLIFVTSDEASPLVVLEGHARLTAYLIAPDWLPPELEVIVGFSGQITAWGCY